MDAGAGQGGPVKLQKIQEVNMEKQDAGKGVLYEIRKDGIVIAQSYLPLCGYSPQEIKNLQAAGFELYADGKKVKRAQV